MTVRTLLLVALLATALPARPPRNPPFMRMDELEVKLADLADRLRKQEEFAAKTRQERMILRFGEGATEFEGRRLTDEGFVKEILDRWRAVQKPLAQVGAEQIRILELLPAALKARYDVMPIPKAERYQASKVLVKALKSTHDTIRKAAIDSLHAIYGRRLMYRHDAPKGQRSQRAAKWRKKIEELRR